MFFPRTRGLAKKKSYINIFTTQKAKTYTIGGILLSTMQNTML